MAREHSSATQVAAAAPATPIPAVNINMGSNIMLTKFEITAIFSGVRTSRVPRNTAKPIVDKIDGTKVIARTAKYGAANALAGASKGRTEDSALSGSNVRNAIPITPMIMPMKTDSPTWFCTPSLSPAPAHFAINGVMTEGRNDTIQKHDEKTWFAAPCPASARVFDILPTQNVSTAPTSGRIAKFNIAGKATFLFKF